MRTFGSRTKLRYVKYNMMCTIHDYGHRLSLSDKKLEEKQEGWSRINMMSRSGVGRGNWLILRL